MKITKIAEGPTDLRCSVALRKGAIVRIEFYLKSDYEAQVYFEDLTQRLNAGQGVVLTMEGPTRVKR